MVEMEIKYNREKNRICITMAISYAFRASFISCDVSWTISVFPHILAVA